jgi:hypothetical protein
MVRRQFVLDGKTNRLLNELASEGSGNLSHVVRNAIRVYAMMEDRLEEIEKDPRFQDLMARSARAIREGRTVTQEELERKLRAARRRRRG